ncbi:hypothetical protein H5410_004905, partial [Solanum commersonii]
CTKQSIEKEKTQLQQHQHTLLQTCKSHNYASSQVGNTNSETQVVNEQVNQNASQSNMRNSQIYSRLQLPYPSPSPLQAKE